MRKTLLPNPSLESRPHEAGHPCAAQGRPASRVGSARTLGRMTIHLWHTTRLRAELANNSVSERDAASYMLVAAGVYTYTFYAAGWFGGYQHWTVLFEAVMVAAISLVGTYECFRANGGAQGTQFIHRFCALSVPVGLKFAVVSAALALFMFHGIHLVVTPAAFRDPAFVIRVTWFTLNLALAFAFYWRLVHHITAMHSGRGAPNAA
jgi:hypothetical protein